MENRDNYYVLYRIFSISYIICYIIIAVTVLLPKLLPIFIYSGADTGPRTEGFIRIDSSCTDCKMGLLGAIPFESYNLYLEIGLTALLLLTLLSLFTRLQDRLIVKFLFAIIGFTGLVALFLIIMDIIQVGLSEKEYLTSHSDYGNSRTYDFGAGFFFFFISYLGMVITFLYHLYNFMTISSSKRNEL